MPNERPLSLFAMFGLATIPFWILGAVAVVIEHPVILLLWIGSLVPTGLWWLTSFSRVLNAHAHLDEISKSASDLR
jgi:hypothetical protein